MSYIMQDLLYGVGGFQATPKGGMVGKLTYRQDVEALGGLQKLMDAILELSRDYRFQGLEETGPATTLIAGQSEYPISYFTNQNADIVNLIPSFYMNYASYGPNPVPGAYKSGTQLLWKSVDALELMLNSNLGEPSYFTRYGNNVIIAPTPQFNDPIYMRYQVEHPFSKPVSLEDPFLLPNEWREIAEYAGAMRFADDARMLDYAASYRTKLFGDPMNPRSIGLIAQRITQIQGDSTANTAMRQIRVAVSRY